MSRGGRFNTVVSTVAFKNDLALKVPPASSVLIVAYLPGQDFRSASMSMDVADDVVHDRFPGRSSDFTVPMVASNHHRHSGRLEPNNSNKEGASAHPAASDERCRDWRRAALTDP